MRYIKILFLVFLLSLVFLLILAKSNFLKSEYIKGIFGRKKSIIYRTNQLNLNYDLIEKTINIPVNLPVELDFLTKDEILKLRIDNVNKFPELVQNVYVPSSHLFGEISGKKPWWGLNGQFCLGDGEKSIDGYSEESRFFLNPFLLVGVDEINAYQVQGPCEPIYIEPKQLHWEIEKQNAIVMYDYSNFINKKRRHKFDESLITFELQDYNARDFGFKYLHASKRDSKNILITEDTRFFSEILAMKNFIHLGKSCGYIGGCNNASPYKPEMNFRIEKIPAILHLKLWKEKPQNMNQLADFSFIINFY